MSHQNPLIREPSGRDEKKEYLAALIALGTDGCPFADIDELDIGGFTATIQRCRPMNVSDDCHDALADLLFNYLPAMDERELTVFFEAVMRIIQTELTTALIRPDAARGLRPSKPGKAQCLCHLTGTKGGEIMFQVIGNSSGCQVCDKDRPSFLVKCEKGTIEGAVCPACLTKLVAAREKIKNGKHDTPLFAEAT